MTREELELLLTLPEHKFVKVQQIGSRKTAILKCSYPLTMVEHQNEDELPVMIYNGNDYAIVEGKALSNPSDNYVVVHILQEVPDPGQRIVDWIIQKIDFSLHIEQKNQEARIDNLHKKLDGIWEAKDGTTKLDVLYDELLIIEQAEAIVIDDNLE